MPTEPTEEELVRAAEIIKTGGLVAFPTETVYGLGANALNAEAISRIYRVKGRPAESPLIVHVADLAMAKEVTGSWPPVAQTLGERFWPGPLTLVLPKAAKIPEIVTGGLKTVGVRVPANKIAVELIRRACVPIAAPSANRFGQLSPTTAEHVREALGGDVDAVLDGGPTLVGIESTVVSLIGDAPVILRLGMVTQAQLEAATASGWQVASGAERANESPGMHPRHYAPNTPFYLLEADEQEPAGRGRIIQMPEQPREYAAQLYAALHAADREGWDWIALNKPPDKPEWAPILDRLRRASTKL